jgi:hypothetical protein
MKKANTVEYYVLMYVNGNKRCIETVPGMEGWMYGVISTMICCKNFCKCHNVT